ncbi:AMP-binding protein [Iamia sp. SCSIO 61187]|uniref:AMP-dependent synthetase/ligase n=1 Tax=Iamia sp. SCSIO 61187 TaxID=2722752 RepID=UPI001C6304D5|nr:AMP-dependent synthetase/ligase [Iamia sp. SCSIO 61187]QYG91046.1 AMP-binding protein [Iamia sp. SCSIO 61187]
MTTSTDVDAAVAGKTAPTYFRDTVARIPDRCAVRWKEGEEWREWTFAEVADLACRAAAGLTAAGIGRGDRVVLMMRNCPEFHVLDLAALLVGATPISIYNSSSPDQIAYLVGHCEAKLAIVEDASFADRFAPVRDQLPHLATLAAVRPEGTDATIGFADLVAHDPVDLDEAVAVGTPDDLVTIIYTSGTTGPPKGVMLTHGNVVWAGESLRIAIEADDSTGWRLVSYLPMAHIAERVTSHYSMMMLGYEISCCPDPALIGDYAREVRPQLMFGVPRVWEKINARVTAALSADAEKGRQFAEAVEAAKPIAERMAWGTATDEDRATWDFLDQVAFQGIRQLLGFDALELAISGAAPIPADLLAWYRAIGVPMSEIYGMSENSGPMCWAPYRVRPGSVGPAVPGLEVALGDDGEIVCRGGLVFQGYLNDPEKTAETLDADGWLHSGDIGELDDDGYFKIVDRKKELIITAGGKNISPANLEAALKSIPLVGQACAIGDQRPFVSALVVLDPDEAPVWAKQRGLEGLSMDELAEHPDVKAAIDEGLQQVMAPFNNAERVKKVKVLGAEWMADSELLTPTSKLKRRGIHATFAAEIEELYRR